MRSTILMPVLGLLPLCLVLATGCKDDDSGTGNTDDTDNPVTYADGCIAVSSATQGFENLDDAMLVAEAGATIELCDDLTKTITVSKALTIVGNGVLVTPAVNTPAVIVTGDGDLTIDNIDIESTRSGFVVEAGGKLNVSKVDLNVVANYGIDVASGAEVIADDLTMTAPDWGGVRVTGGTLTLTNSEIRDPGAFGVFAESNANVTVEDTIITNIAHRDGSTQLWDIDGVGVWLETGSTGTMARNLIGNAEIAAVSADGNSTLTMDSDEIVGGFAGITVRQSSFSASNISADGYGVYGMLCLGCDDASMQSVSFTTDPATSRPSTTGQEGGGYGSVGVYAIESNVTITGTPELRSQFSGHNSAAIIITPQTGGSTSSLTMTEAVVDSNFGLGLGVYSGEIDLTNVDVTNTLNDDANCITDAGYSCNMAMALFTTSGSITGGLVADSNDWGVAVVNGVLEVDGGTYARNYRNSLFAQAGSLVVANTLFNEGYQNHVTVQQGSTGVVDNCTFSNGSFAFDNESDNGTQITRTISHYQAQEIIVSDGDMTLLNSTFKDGDRGITVFGTDTDPAEITITDTTFTGYNQQVLNGSSYSKWDVRRVAIKDVGRYGAYCYNCEMAFKDVSFENTTKYLYRYEYYVDGELQFDSQFEQAGEVMYAYLADFSLENVTIDGAESRALYAYNTTLEFDDVQAKNLLTDDTDRAAFDLTWTERVIDGAVEATSYPNAVIAGLSIEGQVGAVDESGDPVGAQDALFISSWSDRLTGDQAEGLIELVNFKVIATADGSTSGDGLDVNNVGAISINGMDVSGVKGVGMRLLQTSADVTGAAAGRTGVIDTTGGMGIVIDADRKDYADNSVSLTDVTVSGTVGDGISVNQGEHTFTGVAVSGATGWGARCVDVTFVSCDATLSGDLGATDGCTACIAD